MDCPALYLPCQKTLTTNPQEKQALTKSTGEAERTLATARPEGPVEAKNAFVLKCYTSLSGMNSARGRIRDEARRKRHSCSTE